MNKLFKKYTKPKFYKKLRRHNTNKVLRFMALQVCAAQSKQHIQQIKQASSADKLAKELAIASAVINYSQSMLNISKKRFTK